MSSNKIKLSNQNGDLRFREMVWVWIPPIWRAVLSLFYPPVIIRGKNGKNSENPVGSNKSEKRKPKSAVYRSFWASVVYFHLRLISIKSHKREMTRNPIQFPICLHLIQCLKVAIKGDLFVISATFWLMKWAMLWYNINKRVLMRETPWRIKNLLLKLLMRLSVMLLRLRSWLESWPLRISFRPTILCFWNDWHLLSRMINRTISRQPFAGITISKKFW